MLTVKRKLTEKKKYAAVCENCLHGRLSPDEETVLCIKKGIQKCKTKAAGNDNAIPINLPTAYRKSDGIYYKINAKNSYMICSQFCFLQ